MPAQSDRIRLFISHSAYDTTLAEHVVRLLRSALNLSASEVRCTSVDGYRLPGGADTDDQLRQEVHATDAFVGIVSTASVRSPYVLFELGARWGARKHLLPLLAPGTAPSIMGGPLAGLNALRSDSRPQLQQLVTDLARALDIEPETPAAYEADIAAILALPADTQPTRAKEVPGTPETSLPAVPAEATRILVTLSQQGHVRVPALAAAIGQSRERTQYFLDMLLDKAWVDAARAMGSPPKYFLARRGRDYLFEQGLLK